MRLIDGDALMKEAGRLWSDMPDGEELSKELMKAINHAPTVRGWVSVKDRMPDELDCYLVSLVNHGGIDLDVYHPDEKVFSHNRQYVECWMAIPLLPEPSEEVNEDA